MEFNFEGKEATELEARKLELREAMTAEDADLDAIEAEARAINTELEARKAAMEKREKEIKEVLETRSEPVEEMEKREEMTEKEIRSSKEYVDAYVRYIKEKDNDGSECRALLSTNAPANGSIPVPTYVQGRIEAAWENDEILSRISKSYFQGNLKVGVEMSADPAAIHEEGTDAPAEENLGIAIVEIIAKSVKKWITVSDEVLDLKAEEFLDYIYDEIEYQIIKKAAETALATVGAAPTSGTTAPTVGTKSISALGLTDIVEAMGQLSGSARNVCFIASRATIAAYRAEAMNGNFAQDIFAGATVIPTDILKGFDATASGAAFAYLGDLAAIRGNFPNGDEVKFTFDPYSLSESDLVKIVGRLYAGFGLVRDKAFVKLVNANQKS